MVKLFWNREEQRLRAFWRLSLQLLLTIVGVIVFGVALSVWTAGQLLPDLIAWSCLITLLAVLASVALAGRFLDRRPFVEFGFRLRRDWWLDLGFGLALGALLIAAIFAVEWAAGWVSITGTAQTSLPGLSFSTALSLQLLFFLCVGFYEELLSRGYILRNLAEGFNCAALGPRGALLLAWGLSSLVFGMAHLGNPNATLVSSGNIALAGLFLGLGYILTGDLAIPIGLHIAWNFFQGNVFGFPVSGLTSTTSCIVIQQGGPALWTGGAFGPEGGLLGVLAMLVGSLLTWGWVRSRYGRVTLRRSLAEWDRQPQTRMLANPPPGTG